MAYALAARLERAVKNAGVKYKKVSGWASRGHGTMGSIQSIICHHTAGPARGNTPSLNVVAYGRPGLSGPLSQLFLARDGTVYLVAAGVSYHAGRVVSNKYTNSHAIGIEAEATGVSSWPAHQVNEYAKLCKALAKEFGLSTSRVVGHKEAAPSRKIDPNFSMNDFRAKVGGAKGGVSSGGGSSGGKSYESAKAKHTVGSRTMGMCDGGTDVNWFQRRMYKLGYKITPKSDGSFDSLFGPELVSATRKLQEKVGITVDGLAGKDTIAAAKAEKPVRNLPKGPKRAKPKSKPKAKLTVDGKWGTGTTRALQRVLGTPVDGKVSFQPAAYKSQNPGLMTGWKWTNSPRSSNVIEALQGKLGVGEDGRIGPNTIRTLQRKLGTPVDGKVSNPSAMVKQLQRNLNAGKLW